MIKNIFFDFDGVIVESVQLKTNAFTKIYEKYGEDIQTQVKTHHQSNGGMSRFEKFRFYHKNFLGMDITEKEIQKLSNKFSAIVMNNIIKAEEVNGATEFLERYYQTHNLFIISATPDDEIEIICNKRNISKYFKSIHGSPNNKKFWCKFILEKNKLNPEETIFIGDALSDYEAAIENKISFFLREHNENIPLFLNIDVSYRFNDFYSISI